MSKLENVIKCQDAAVFLREQEPGSAQCVIADPPYYRVLDEQWDKQWASEEAYLQWSVDWVNAAMQALAPDGLLFLFGQTGKREQVFLTLMAWLRSMHRFHDLVIWDRVLGYRDRSDSFTPQYEMALVLARKDLPAKKDPYFNKDAVRIPYTQEKIKAYMRDPRYKDKEARARNLAAGKHATNILRPEQDATNLLSIPSLKGASQEKAGHPAQKPRALIETFVKAASRPGDLVLDPFLGCGTTAVVCKLTGRRFRGSDNAAEYVDMAKARMLRDPLS